MSYDNENFDNKVLLHEIKYWIRNYRLKMNYTIESPSQNKSTLLESLKIIADSRI
jgi:hypothetical protein